MLQNKKNKVIFVNKSVRPSRFLLDLVVPEEEEAGNAPFSADAKAGAKGDGLFTRLSSFHLKKKKQVDRMTIFSVFKVFFVIFKLFFKACYHSGLIFVGIVRFLGMIFKRACVLDLKTIRLRKLFFKSKSRSFGFLSKAEKKAEKETISKEFALLMTLIQSRKKAEKKKPFFVLKKIFSPLKLKPTLIFFLILFILVMPLKAFVYYNEALNLKDRVFGYSAAAVDDIKSAGAQAMDLNFSEANKGFVRAGSNFLEAKNEISEIRKFLSVLSALIPNNKLKLAGDADLFLEAGRLSAEIGSGISGIMEVFEDDELNVKKVLTKFYEHDEKLRQDANEFSAVIAKIDADALPTEYQGVFREMQDKAELLSGSLREFFDVMRSAGVLLGLERDKRYLFVFQNNAELRASGGFVGSFALVDLSDGEIANIEVPSGGSYDTAGGLLERVAAPEPLRLVSAQWNFWDANWWPDWQRSAEKLAWFYERSGGPTVDGVIGLTPTVLEKLLEVTGPIDMTEKYNIIFDKENAWFILQLISEQKLPGHPDYERYSKAYKDIIGEVPSDSVIAAEAINEDGEGSIFEAQSESLETDEVSASESLNPAPKQHEPKKIIGDLFAEISKSLKEDLSKDLFFGLSEVVLKSLNEKQILFYFVDEALQSEAEKYGWSGRMKSTNEDYLMVVNSNIAGAKTDRVISEEIKHKSEVSANGEIINTVTITRQHNGRKGDLFTGVRNVNWLRVYVPVGSKLLSASGFSLPDDYYFKVPEADWKNDSFVVASEGRAETDPFSGTKIYKEKYKTVFANWCLLDPGETRVVSFKYVLPFQIKLSENNDDLKSKIGNLFALRETRTPYSLLVQKQPGSIASQFSSELILPENYSIEWRHNHTGGNDRSWRIENDLRTDRYWAALIGIGDD